MFSIVHTQGDDSRILASFETMQEALDYGDRIWKDDAGRGLVTLQETLRWDADVKSFRLFEKWPRMMGREERFKNAVSDNDTDLDMHGMHFLVAETTS